MKYRRILFALIAAFATTGSCISEQGREVDIWPTDGWATAEPEAQGVSSSILAEMIEEIISKNLHIDSVQIVRNGYMVLQAYRYPFSPQDGHIIHSCTKSIVSTLIGIAIENEYFDSVNESIYEIFSDVELAAEPEYDLTLRRLLMMATGLRSRDSYLHRWKGLQDMRRTDDWVKFILSLPFDAKPGMRFDYSNMSSFLLAAALQKRTGLPALQFARMHLFEPLGISNVEWPESPSGINIGWGELIMRPEDLAKIGLLFLQNGMWEEQRIVSEKWVREATSMKIRAATLRELYGYQWWIDPSGAYMALGYGGQYLIIEPKLELITVFTSSLPEQLFFTPWQLYDAYVRKAVGDNGALSGDPESELQSALNQFSAGPPSIRQNTSPLAERVSGAGYQFEPNPFGMTGITIIFDRNRAIVREHYGEDLLDHETGLNGRFLFNDFGSQGTVAVRAHWKTATELFIEYYSIGGAWRTELSLSFLGDRIEAAATTGSGATYTFTGHLVAR